MADIERLEDEQLEDATGGSGGEKWAVRCGACGLTHKVCGDKLQAAGVSNSLIINGKHCPNCGRSAWYVTRA